MDKTVINKSAERVAQVFVETRVEMDAMIKGLERLRDRTETHAYGTGRALSVAITELETGRMWAGEVMNALGTPYPYKGTNEASTPDQIAPAADKADYVPDHYDTENYIRVLGAARTRFDQILNDTMFDYMTYCNNNKVDITTVAAFIKNFKDNESFMQYHSHTKQGRMWLGVAMGNIRDNANK